MAYIIVSYLVGIISSVIAYFIHKKYPGKLGRMFSVVFGLIGVLVIIYTIIITIVMLKSHRSY